MSTFRRELIEETQQVMQLVFDEVIEEFGKHPLGHGFLWCRVNINGRSVKTLIGGGNSADWSKVQGRMKEVFPCIESTWINWD